MRDAHQRFGWTYNPAYAVLLRVLINRTCGAVERQKDPLDWAGDEMDARNNFPRTRTVGRFVPGSQRGAPHPWYDRTKEAPRD
jgi:hypothetical protein